MTRCDLSDSKPSIQRIDRTPWQPYGSELCPPIAAVRTVPVAGVYTRREEKLLKQDHQPTPASSSNAELVTRAQRGEEKAFEALFLQHRQHVYSLCLRMIGNTAEAEDLTQEAFLQVFRKIHTFRGESAFSTWLHRLSVNIVLMRLRKKKITEAPLEDSAREGEFDAPRMEIGAPDPALTGSIDRMHLERAIARLPPGYKQAFVLHDVHGYEHNEIAAMMGYSIGNSKSQLHKARTRLRELLQEAGRESHRQKELQVEPA
jgi:RNA polymerase sigma-70 factor (ECF subfamily)